MQKHKYYKEIVAWAEGKTVEMRSKDLVDNTWSSWETTLDPSWSTLAIFEYRIQDPYRELKEAYAAGKTIQCIGSISGTWGDLGNPVWDCPVDNYRIKPEPEYIPFTFLDAKSLLSRKIIHIPTGDFFQIQGVESQGIYLIGEHIPFKLLLEEYVFVSNHEPCGMKKFKS